MILETLGRYRGYKELIVHHHDLSRLMSLDRCALCHLLDMECGYRDMLAKPSSSVRSVDLVCIHTLENSTG